MGSSLLLVLLALALVLLNGFFVAAEFGLVKLRPTRVRAIALSHGWRGRILGRVHGDLDTYLSACQLGITLASLGLGWVGEPAFADLCRPVLDMIGITDEEVIHGFSFFFAFFTISFLHIVVGELAPKSLAIRLAEPVALWTAPPLYAFYWLMYPAIRALNFSAGSVLRLIGLKTPSGHDTHYSAEELKLILRNSPDDPGFTAEEWRVLAHSLDFRQLDVGDLMRPINEAVLLDAELSLDANIERMLTHRFSRYPYVGTEGRISGIVHLKDVFAALRRTPALTSLDSLLRPAGTVPPTLPASELLRRFRQGTPHFVIVAHGEDDPLGFITLDHLIGALVGEIRDEFRQVNNEWQRLDDGSLIGKASLPIFSLERTLGIDIEEVGADSVGGLVLHQLGDLPSEGQRIAFRDFDIVIKRMSGPRIVLLRVIPKAAGTHEN